MNKKVFTTATAAVLTLGLVGCSEPPSQQKSAEVAQKTSLLKVPVWFGTHLTGLGSPPKWLSEHVNEA